MDAHKSAIATLISNGAITPHANAEVLARLFLEVGPTGQITSKLGTYPAADRGFFLVAAAMGQAGRNPKFLDINWLHGFHHTFGIFQQIEEGILSRKKAADETYVTIFFPCVDGGHIQRSSSRWRTPQAGSKAGALVLHKSEGPPFRHAHNVL